MPIQGNIISIEDDVKDKEIFHDIVTDLGFPNQIIWFTTTDEALSIGSITEERVFQERND